MNRSVYQAPWVSGTGVAILLIIGFLGCNRNVSPEEQAAVEAVWKKYGQAELRSLEEFQTAGRDTESTIDPWTRAHAARLEHMRDIDVARTPKPFRDAWADYIEALEAHRPSVGLNAMKEGNDKAIEDLLEMNAPLKKAEAELAQQFAKCSPEIALEFARTREQQADSD